MFTSTAFTIVVVDNKSPGLITCPEPLGNPWNGIFLALLGAVLVVESNVHLTAFIIGRLKSHRYDSMSNVQSKYTQ